MSPADLRRAIEAARKCGWVSCDWRPRTHAGEPTSKELDTFVIAAVVDDAHESEYGGAGPDEDAYREVDLVEARYIIGHWVKHSIAYGPWPRGPGLVSDVAEPFFALFTAARFFTNVTMLDASGTWQFSSKTRHTFDIGIVAVDDVNIGLIWFAEED